MKVMHVSYEGLGNGGIQAVIMTICRNNPDIMFDILLFTNERRHYDDEFENLGGNIYRINQQKKKKGLRRHLAYLIKFFKVFIGTYRLLNGHGPYDAIHCHNGLESASSLLAAKLCGVPLRIVHSHISEEKFSKANLMLYAHKIALKKMIQYTANYKIGCSKNSFNSLFSNKYLNRKNSFIIPNSIDLTKFKRNEMKSNTGSIRILNVGRFSKNKNQIFIIELLPIIKQNFDNVEVRLIGSGETYEREINDKANELNVEANVKILPPNTDVSEQLQQSDLFIFPSLNEGFGIVLLEAQAMGVPCLVSDTVPQEADCGLCKYLSLSQNKQIWANTAIEIINKKLKLELDAKKINMLDSKRYSTFFNQIYRGDNFEGWDTYFSQSQ